jgi:signal transduction histidine kinase
VWRNEFLWSGVAFIVAAGAGAATAMVISRGNLWTALLLPAPIYLAYRASLIYVARLDQRHMVEMGSMDEVRHELRERERFARATAEETNRLKGQFLAIVSHELRTPLNTILGWTDMLRKGVLDEERRERAYQAVWDSAQRQAQLIEGLLDAARIDSGNLCLAITPVDLHHVIREALNVVQPAADAKGVRVTFVPEDDVGLIDADRARFHQIAWNLVSNAIKFTPTGGSVTVRLRRTSVNIELIVEDTGQGIPDGFLHSIFEPFRQADESTTRANGGLGLGLSIVKHLVEAHGGTIAVYSAGAGEGSTFTVRLPIPESTARRAACPVRRVGS